MENHISLGQLCKQVNMPLKKIKYWMDKGYLAGYSRVQYPNGMSGYLFSNKHVLDITRVNQLRDEGYSLGAGWLMVQRGTKDLGAFINGVEK